MRRTCRYTFFRAGVGGVAGGSSSGWNSHCSQAPSPAGAGSAARGFRTGGVTKRSWIMYRMAPPPAAAAGLQRARHYGEA